MTAEGAMEVPKNMARYWLVLVSKGEAWKPDWRELQRRHLEFNRRMAEAGHLLLFGPLLDDADLRAAAVVNTSSPEGSGGGNAAGPGGDRGSLPL